MDAVIQVTTTRVAEGVSGHGDRSADSASREAALSLDE